MAIDSSGLLRTSAGFCSDFVRVSPGNGRVSVEEVRTTFEQTANNIRSNTGANPAQYGKSQSKKRYWELQILLIANTLQGFLRNSFANPLRQPLGFFANLRRTCEGCPALVWLSPGRDRQEARCRTIKQASKSVSLTLSLSHSSPNPRPTGHRLGIPGWSSDCRGIAWEWSPIV